jgi:LysM repeat protein
MVPPSQKTQPIGFYLEGGGAPPTQFTLYIRPEDQTRTEPSRLNVNQTLGGAWADAFGRGISTITLAGHQGWRGNFTQSGQDLFAELRTTIFTAWHARRAANIALGQDPSLVSLYYIDTLNSISALVAPQSFTLRRSKTSPLLIRYQAQLLVLDDQAAAPSLIDAITAGITDPLRWLSSIKAIQAAISAIQTAYTFVKGIVTTAYGYIAPFIKAAIGVFNVVTNIAQYAQGVFDQTVGAVLQGALGIAVAGRNAFYALSGVSGIFSTQQSVLMGIASSFSDIYCSIINGFNLGQEYTTFDPFLGASNCSSTAGGDPPSYFTLNDENPFEAYYAATAQTITISAAAQAAINNLALDPLPLYGDAATVGPQLGVIGNGITSTTPPDVLLALSGTSAASSSSTLAQVLAAASVSASTPSFKKSLTGYRKVDTNRGDTLQKVAARELGDASQWPDLATLNGLIPPYITDDPTQVAPGIILSGTTLNVPAPAPVPSAVSDSESLFGTDLALDKTGQGVSWNGLLTADDSGDFATLSGPDNLSQALENRIVTRPGELLFHLPYGCKVFDLLGAGNGPIAGQLAATFVSQAIKSDARISSVKGVTATITADSQSIAATAITTAGKSLPVGIAQLPG